MTIKTLEDIGPSKTETVHSDNAYDGPVADAVLTEIDLSENENDVESGAQPYPVGKPAETPAPPARPGHCRRTKTYRSKQSRVAVFSYRSLVAVFSAFAVNSAFAILSVNTLVTILSINSMFSIMSVNSVFAIGCSGKAFAICLDDASSLNPFY